MFHCASRLATSMDPNPGGQIVTGTNGEALHIRQ